MGIDQLGDQIDDLVGQQPDQGIVDRRMQPANLGASGIARTIVDA